MEQAYETLVWAIGAFVAVGVAVQGWVVTQLSKLSSATERLQEKMTKVETEVVAVKSSAINYKDLSEMQQHQAVMAQRLSDTAAILVRLDKSLSDRIADHESRLRVLEK